MAEECNGFVPASQNCEEAVRPTKQSRAAWTFVAACHASRDCFVALLLAMTAEKHRRAPSALFFAARARRNLFSLPHQSEGSGAPGGAPYRLRSGRPRGEREYPKRQACSSHAAPSGAPRAAFCGSARSAIVARTETRTADERGCEPLPPEPHPAPLQDAS